MPDMNSNTPKEEKTTLVSVIDRVKKIADEQHEGKVYDNVLAIFDQLSLRERQTLLRGLINICFLVDNRLLEDSSVSNGCSKTILDHEIDTIESYNKKELIGLKTWLVKMVFKTLLAGVCIYVLLVAVTGGDSGVGRVTSLLETFFKVVGVIVGG